MRIVSWNMNHWQNPPAKRGAAWEYLRDELRADIALVQEAIPPTDLQAAFRSIDDVHPRYRWGSAVVSFRPELVVRPRPRVPLADCYLTPATGDAVPESHRGACAVADILNAAGELQFVAISLYGQWEVLPDRKTMDACARLHRMLSDLTGVLTGPRRPPVVLAGDFNITTQHDHSKRSQAEAESAAVVFSRLRAWGLVDCIAATREIRPRLASCTCRDGASCSHVPTFRIRNQLNSSSNQLDYVFASDSLVSALVRCEVVDDEQAWALSDHCPILLELSTGRLVRPVRLHDAATGD